MNGSGFRKIGSNPPPYPHPVIVSFLIEYGYVWPQLSWISWHTVPGSGDPSIYKHIAHSELFERDYLQRCGRSIGKPQKMG